REEATGAQAGEAQDRLPGDRVERRVYRAEQEGAGQARPLEDLADDPGLQGLDVDEDVRQLRHGVRPYNLSNLGHPGSQRSPASAAAPSPRPSPQGMERGSRAARRAPPPPRRSR